MLGIDVMWSFREKESEKAEEGIHLDHTVPKSLATVLEKRLLLDFTANYVKKIKRQSKYHQAF